MQAGHPLRRDPIESLKDIERLEAGDYETIVPVTNTYNLFRRSADLFGDRPAITFLPTGDPADAPIVRTYRTLLLEITAAANLFHSLGVGPDDAVAFLLPPIPEAHLTLWGAEAAGRACPINYMLDAKSIASIIKAAGAKILVAYGPDAALAIWDKVPEILRSAPSLEHAIQVRGSQPPDPGAPLFSDLLAAARSDRLAFERRLGRRDLAAYYHTGGTTGTLKLAQHTHGNEVHTSWFAGLFYDLGPDDALLSGFPLFHVAGAFVFGGAAFAAGANLVMPTALGLRHREFMSNYWRFAETHRLSVLAAVPTVMAALLDQPVGASDVSCVRLLLTGGSPLPNELAAGFESRFRIPVRNILGMTECAGIVSIIPARAPRTAGSCGWRLPYTQVRAVPIAEGGEPLLDRDCATGEPGVIVLRGPHVGPGYKDASRNRGTFDPDGWLISGDLGHIDQAGQVHITGRAKDVIIRGAHNIDPAMIEDAVLRHPVVQMCAAVGEPDAYAGELPVVFVVLRPGSHASPQDIIAETASLIAERAAIPKRCIILDALPVTAIGKVYKPALRALATKHAFQDALEPLGALGIACKVAVAEEPGGLCVRVTVSGANDRDPIEEQIRNRVGPFSAPCELIWDASCVAAPAGPI